jgi:transcriptional regulator with XRE-family HTH domain
MPGEAAHGAKSTPPLRTLADKVNWLISTAHPAGRGPYSNAEVAALIRKTTGERVSHTTIWKLRNGQATNPQKRLIEAMARTFGVRPSFFFGGHDENQIPHSTGSSLPTRRCRPIVIFATAERAKYHRWAWSVVALVVSGHDPAGGCDRRCIIAVGLWSRALVAAGQARGSRDAPRQHAEAVKCSGRE